MAEVQAGVLYVDTSALVKLVTREAESDVLEEELRRWNDLATSVDTSIELSRAVARARSDSAAVVADEYTILGVLASLAELPLNDDVRAAASTLGPVELRTLDAIHLASALTLGDDLGVPRRRLGWRRGPRWLGAHARTASSAVFRAVARWPAAGLAGASFRQASGGG